MENFVGAEGNGVSVGVLRLQEPFVLVVGVTSAAGIGQDVLRWVVGKVDEEGVDRAIALESEERPVALRNLEGVTVIEELVPLRDLQVP